MLSLPAIELIPAQSLQLELLFLHHLELTADPQDFSKIVANACRGKASKMQIADFLRKKSIMVD